MKKAAIRIASAVFAAIMSVGVFASCSKKPEPLTEYTGDFRDRYDYDLNEYLEAGEYKWIEIVTNNSAPTQREIDAQILNYRVLYTATVTDIETIGEGIPSEKGNIANVKYQGYLDGKEIENFSSKNENGDEISLGKDDIIDGVDAEIIGMKIGEKKTVTVTVPEVCLAYPELVGKTITVDVELMAMRKEVSKWKDAGDGAAAQMNDIVDIKYQGYLDGKALNDIVNSKKEGYSIALGTYSLFDGVDEQIVGMKVGDKKTVTVTVPDPCFNYPYYVGKTITIDIELAGIRRAELEPCDAEFYEYYGCTDEHSFEEQVISELRRVRSEKMEDYVLDRVMYTVVDNFKVKSYPEKELEEVRTGTIDSIKAKAESRSVTYEDYVKDNLGQTVEEYEKSVDEYAHDVVKHEMVMYYIARREQIALTNAAFDEKAEMLAQEYELSTPAEYVSYMAAQGYSESAVREQVWFELVYDFMYKNTVTK